MQPLYTEEEFGNAKSRQPLPLKCIHCHKTFHRPKNKIQLSLIPNHKGGYTHNYCSASCQRLHQNPKVFVKCEFCNKKFTKLPNQIKTTKHNFCDKSCAAKYNNSHKTKGNRISKLELWLQEQLPILYPSLEFHFNRKDAINGELDIYIPSLKLAFELNGIFHYEPIYGPEKLSSIQNNDLRKSQACLEHNIELCLIDVSHQIYFKEQTSLKFLKIIQEVINIKTIRISE